MEVRRQEGERVLFESKPSVVGTLAYYVFTLGLYALWRSRTTFLITDRRVVVAKGIINRFERTMPLVKVQDATVRRTLWITTVVVTSAGGASGVEVIGPLTQEGAQHFVEVLLDQAPGTVGPELSLKSTADELAKLADLRDRGILTDQEFQVQKTKILS
ncbi:MAG: SHOCT domain-containing protein [Acidimicrobiales bacterium]